MKTRKDYLVELKKNLKKILPKEEAINAYNYFEEYIEEADYVDYDIISIKLGTPREVSYNAIIDYQENQLQTDKQKIKWGLPLTLLLSAPISIPLVMVAASLMLVALILVGTAAGLVYLFAALGWFIGAVFIFASLVSLFLHVSTAIFYLGIGLIFISIAWMVTPPLLIFSKKIAVGGYKYLLNKIRPKNKGETSYVE